MGLCSSSNLEKQAYEKGENADLLQIGYQRALRQQREEASYVKAQQVLERHSSKSSFNSGSTYTNVLLSQMSPQERDAFLLEKMKREMKVLEKRKAFLEGIRDALTEINGDVESLDSEEENDRFQDEFQRKIIASEGENLDPIAKKRAEVARHLKKVNNFRLKEFNRASLRRSLKKPLNKTAPVPTSVNNKRDSSARKSRPVIGKLVGEGTREWTNAFGARLSLLRRFYDWDDIPLEFFVDKQVDLNSGTRKLLQARMAEKKALHQLMNDAALFGTEEVEEAQAKTQKHKVSVGDEVIEIDLASLDSSDSEEDEGEEKENNFEVDSDGEVTTRQKAREKGRA